MGILDNLNARFQIGALSSGSTQSEIENLISVSNRAIPNDYIELIGEATEIEILVDNEQYFRIWGPSGCIEFDEAYLIQKYLPGSFAFGDDEGGSMLIILDGNEGEGIYKVGFGDLDLEGCKFVARNIRSLLIDGIGNIF